MSKPGAVTAAEIQLLSSIKGEFNWLILEAAGDNDVLKINTAIQNAKNLVELKDAINKLKSKIDNMKQPVQQGFVQNANKLIEDSLIEIRRHNASQTFDNIQEQVVNSSSLAQDEINDAAKATSQSASTTDPVQPQQRTQAGAPNPSADHYVVIPKKEQLQTQSNASTTNTVQPQQSTQAGAANPSADHYVVIQKKEQLQTQSNASTTNTVQPQQRTQAESPNPSADHYVVIPKKEQMQTQSNASTTNTVQPQQRTQAGAPNPSADHYVVIPKKEQLQTQSNASTTDPVQPQQSTQAGAANPSADRYVVKQKKQQVQTASPSVSPLMPTSSEIPTPNAAVAVRRFVVSFKEKGKTISAKDQAQQIIEEFEKEIAAGRKVAITYSANSKQADDIYKGYETGDYSIRGSNQAKVIKLVIEEIHKRGWEDKAHILPVATMSYDKNHKIKPVSRESVEHDLSNIAQHVGAGWTVLGYQNQDSKPGELAVGGAISKAVWDDQKDNKQLFDQGMKKMLQGDYSDFQESYEKGQKQGVQKTELLMAPVSKRTRAKAAVNEVFRGMRAKLLRIKKSEKVPNADATKQRLEKLKAARPSEKSELTFSSNSNLNQVNSDIDKIKTALKSGSLLENDTIFLNDLLEKLAGVADSLRKNIEFEVKIYLFTSELERLSELLNPSHNEKLVMPNKYSDESKESLPVEKERFEAFKKCIFNNPTEVNKFLNDNFSPQAQGLSNVQKYNLLKDMRDFIQNEPGIKVDKDAVNLSIFQLMKHLEPSVLEHSNRVLKNMMTRLNITGKESKVNDALISLTSTIQTQLKETQPNESEVKKRVQEAKAAVKLSSLPNKEDVLKALENVAALYRATPAVVAAPQVQQPSNVLVKPQGPPPSPSQEMVLQGEIKTKWTLQDDVYRSPPMSLEDLTKLTERGLKSFEFDRVGNTEKFIAKAPVSMVADLTQPTIASPVRPQSPPPKAPPQETSSRAKAFVPDLRRRTSSATAEKPNKQPTADTSNNYTTLPPRKPG